METNETDGQSSPSANVFRVLTVDTPKRTNQTLNPDPTLQNGRILPKKLQAKFTDPNAWGKPMEDIDPYYENGKTFIVISSKFRLFRFSAHHSLFLFNPFNTLRRFFLFILTHWIYHAVMTTIVALYFVLLASWNSTAQPIPYHNLGVTRIVSMVFMLIYFLEFLMKLIAMGFAKSPFTMIRSFWCWLDVIIIFPYLIERAFEDANVVSFGEAHLLLKVVYYSPGLHMAFDFLVSCVVRLKEMLLSSAVILSMLSIIGLQIYMGVLTQKCITNFNGTYLNITEEEYHTQWHNHAFNSTEWLFRTDGEVHLCGNFSGSGKCPEGYTCLQGHGPNPDYGYTSFDSFGWSFLSVLRFVTQDFTEHLIQQIAITASHFHVFYFIFAFFVGTFGLGTFAWGVVAHKFLEMKDMKDEITNSASDDSENQNSLLSRMFQSWNFPSGLNSFSRQVHCFMFHPFSEVCITCVIIFDILLMTVNIEQPVFRQVFCWIYVLEFLAKVFAEGRDYFQHPEHVLDTIIIVLFIFTLLVPSHFLTSFLVMRMFKLFPRWPSLNFIIQSVLNSLKNYWRFYFLIVIIQLIQALQGVNWHSIYGGDHYLKHVSALYRGESFPRWNFQDFEHSFMMTFRVAGGEWIESVWDTMLIHGTLAFFYFIPAVLILTLSIMVASMATIIETGETFSKIEFQENPLYWKFEEGLRKICVPITWLRSKINPGGQTHDILEEAPIHRESQLIEESQGDASLVPNSDNNANEKNRSLIDEIVENKYYTAISIVVILWCSLILTFGDIHSQYHPCNHTIEHSPQDKTIHCQLSPSTSAMIIYYTDIIFTIYFGIDILIKLAGCVAKKSFVSSGWLFDTVLLIEMIFNLLLFSPYTSPIRGFFNIKCFRPFMLVSRIDRLKAAFSGFIKEISVMWKYLLAGCFIILALDIQGVQLFAGRFYKCIDPENDEVLDSKIIATKNDCIANNMTWQNSFANFDNIIHGIRPVFSTLTTNGWIASMHDAADAREEGEQPQKEVNYINNLYFVCVLVFGTFFLFNVMAGILIHFLRTDPFKGIFMTYDQFYDYKNKTRQFEVEKHSSSPHQDESERKIPEPTWTVLKFFYGFVEHPFFDKFIICVIFSQWVFLSMDHYHMNTSWKTFLNIADYCIISVYIVELILKLLGWRQHYFKSVYNIVDFFVVVFLVAGLVLSDLFEKYFFSPVLFRVIRVFQFEPFRRRAVLCRQYLKSFSLVRPALCNLALFILINWFTFSLLFMATFQNVKLRASLNEVFNFQTFWKSSGMLLQIPTYGGWDSVHEALADDTDCHLPDLVLGLEGDCGFPIKASVMIFAYLAVNVFVCLNIYIVFILEIVKQFSENHPKNQSNHQHGTTENNIESSAEVANSNAE